MRFAAPLLPETVPGTTTTCASPVHDGRTAVARPGGRPDDATTRTSLHRPSPGDGGHTANRRRGAQRYHQRRARLEDAVALCSNAVAISVVATLALLPDVPMGTILPVNGALGLVGTILVVVRWAHREADPWTSARQLAPAGVAAVVVATGLGWAPIVSVVLLTRT